MICTEIAHLHVDECGAPERVAGRQAAHRARPRTASCTPARRSPLGGPARRRAPGAAPGRLDHPGHRAGHRVRAGRDPGDRRCRPRARDVRPRGRRPACQRGGVARPASARADHRRSASTCSPSAAPRTGCCVGEAVVFLRPELAETFRFTRKQLGQLASKMRFLAVQFDALLDGDLWRSERRARERDGAPARRGDLADRRRPSRLPGGGERRLRQPPGAVSTACATPSRRRCRSTSGTRTPARSA